MSDWLPVLAGGVSGAVLTLVTTEWRTWRAYRREDRVRFHDKRVDTAAEVLRLSFEARRLQTRRLNLRDSADEVVTQLTEQYRTLVERLEAAASRFYLLFPAAQRAALDGVLAALDSLNSPGASQRPTESLRAARAALDELSASCRGYLTTERVDPVWFGPAKTTSRSSG